MGEKPQSHNVLHRLICGDVMYLRKICSFLCIIKKNHVGGFPPRGPGFDPGSDYVGFVVDKMALGHFSNTDITHVTV
jgi:hypothetical protein